MNNDHSVVGSSIPIPAYVGISLCGQGLCCVHLCIAMRAGMQIMTAAFLRENCSTSLSVLDPSQKDCCYEMRGVPWNKVICNGEAVVTKHR